MTQLYPVVFTFWIPAEGKSLLVSHSAIFIQTMQSWNRQWGANSSHLTSIIGLNISLPWRPASQRQVYCSLISSMHTCTPSCQDCEELEEMTQISQKGTQTKPTYCSLKWYWFFTLTISPLPLRYMRMIKSDYVFSWKAKRHPQSRSPEQHCAIFFLFCIPHTSRYGTRVVLIILWHNWPTLPWPPPSEKQSNSFSSRYCQSQ